MRDGGIESMWFGKRLGVLSGTGDGIVSDDTVGIVLRGGGSSCGLRGTARVCTGLTGGLANTATVSGGGSGGRHCELGAAKD
jgi:hypothetical protein